MVVARDRKPAVSSITTRRKEKGKVPANKKEMKNAVEVVRARPALDHRKRNSPKLGKSPSGKEDKLSFYNYKPERCDIGNERDFSLHFASVAHVRKAPAVHSRIWTTRLRRQIRKFLQRSLRSRKKPCKWFHALFGNAGVNKGRRSRSIPRTASPSLNVIQTRSKTERSDGAPNSDGLDLVFTKCVDKWARQSAWKLLRDVHNIKGSYRKN